MDDSQPPQPSVADETQDNMEDVDEGIEAELNPESQPTQTDPMSLDGAGDAAQPAANGTDENAPIPEARIPAKKDASLREFLGKMDDYAPIVCLSEYTFTIGQSSPYCRVPPTLTDCGA